MTFPDGAERTGQDQYALAKLAVAAGAALAIVGTLQETRTDLHHGRLPLLAVSLSWCGVLLVGSAIKQNLIALAEVGPLRAAAWRTVRHVRFIELASLAAALVPGTALAVAGAWAAQLLGSYALGYGQADLREASAPMDPMDPMVPVGGPGRQGPT